MAPKVTTSCLREAMPAPSDLAGCFEHRGHGYRTSRAASMANSRRPGAKREQGLGRNVKRGLKNAELRSLTFGLAHGSPPCRGWSFIEPTLPMGKALGPAAVAPKLRRPGFQ